MDLFLNDSVTQFTPPLLAPAQFQAGFADAVLHMDVLDAIENCYVDNTNLNEKIDYAFTMLARNRYHYFSIALNETPSMYQENLKNCQNDATVQTMIAILDDIKLEYENQENWQEQIKENVQNNQEALQGYHDQMVNLWFNQDYFKAGRAFGYIEKIVYGWV